MRRFLLSGIILCLFISNSLAQEWAELCKVNPDSYQDPFGDAVAIDSNYAVVGASGYNNNTGCAYILNYNGKIWKIIAQLTASDGSENNYFGNSVSISGENIVIGAYQDDENGVKSGSAYIFTKPKDGWIDMTETAKLVASDGNSEDLFGYSVSIYGDIVAAGAIYDDSKKGSAYIFEKPVSGWINCTESVKLNASVRNSYDQFGYSLSIYDNCVIIGAITDDGITDKSGSVYVFEKPESGWSDIREVAKLTASDGSDYDYFGNSVDIFKNYIVVGAYYKDVPGAYIFKKTEIGWENNNEIAILTPSDAGYSRDYFGKSVCISEGYVAIGANFDNNSRGSAYIYKKPINEWENSTETIKILASDGHNNAYFGSCADISDKHIIIGAPGGDDVYFFEKCYDLIIEKNIDDLQICEGEDVVFSLSVEGIGVDYQWQEHDGTGWKNIDGEINDSLKLSEVSYGKNNFKYRCTIDSRCGVGDTSEVAELTVSPVYNLTETHSIESGSSFTFPDGTVQTNITFQTSHINNLKSILGCDSIVTTILYPHQLSPTVPFTRYYKYDNGLSTGYGTSVIETDNKELFIVGINGQSGDYTNHASMYLIKTDSLGNEIWSTIYNENYVTYGFQGICTLDGSFVVLGRTELVDDGPWRNILVKLSNDGELLWTKQYGDSIYVESFYETFDNGFIMAGGSGDLVKIDEFGEIEWYKDKDDHGYNDPLDIIQLKDSSYVSANIGGVSGYNKLGIEEWQYDYNSGGYFFDDFHSLVETDDSCVIAVGKSEKSGELNVVKLKTNGELVWQKLFPYQASHNFDNYARPVTITKTSDGNFYIGFRSSGMKIIKIDIDGNEIPVQFEYGDGVNINDIIETKDKGVVCISSLSGSSGRWRYFCMMKFDNLGNRCHNFITTDTETINQGENAFFNTDANDVLFWSINKVEIPFTNTTEFSTNDIVDQDIIMCESLGCTSENWIVMNVNTNDYLYNSILCEGEDFIYAILNQEDGTTFQWQEHVGSAWQDMSSETNDTLFIENVSLDMNGKMYRCIVSGSENDTSETATLQVNETYLFPILEFVCSGDSYTFPDGLTISNITSPMKYNSVLQSVHGCDSIIETTINVNPTYNLTEDVTINIGEDYTFPDGTTQTNITSQVVYASNLQTVLGCDSIIETTVIVNCESAYDLTETVSVCSGESYTFPDGAVENDITAQVIHTSNLQTVLGCDSIIETTVNVNPTYKLNETVTINSGESYTFPDGTTEYNITSQIIHTSNLQTVFGCDSIIETTLNVEEPEICYFSESITLCSGSDYTFPDGTIQENITSSLIYESYFESSNGCDSIIETTLNINPTHVVDLSDSICHGEYVQVGYAAFGYTGYYGVFLKNQFGCDSTVYMDLTVFEPVVNLGNDETITVNDTIILDAGEGFESYYWNTEETGSAITFDGSVGVGLYSFDVRVTDFNNCIASDTINITVEDLTDMVSLNDAEGIIKLYPNPTSGKLNIEWLENNQIVEISIYDINGRLILQTEPDPTEIKSEIDIPGEGGIYFVKVSSHKNTNTYKVIKK